MFRYFLIAFHVVVGGAIIITMIVNPDEMVSAGLIPLVLFVGTCVGLAVKNRWTVVPAGLLALVEIFLVVIVTIGNISWSESVSAQTMLVFAILIALEVVTVGYVLIVFRRRK